MLAVRVVRPDHVGTAAMGSGQYQALYALCEKTARGTVNAAHGYLRRGQSCSGVDGIVESSPGVDVVHFNPYVAANS